ncbi:hypothetical protein C8R45DRAFT_1128462, partial [Mycena sanguinolenta]
HDNFLGFPRCTPRCPRALSSLQTASVAAFLSRCAPAANSNRHFVCRLAVDSCSRSGESLVNSYSHWHECWTAYPSYVVDFIPSVVDSPHACPRPLRMPPAPSIAPSNAYPFAPPRAPHVACAPHFERACAPALRILHARAPRPPPHFELSPAQIKRLPLRMAAPRHLYTCRHHVARVPSFECHTPNRFAHVRPFSPTVPTTLEARVRSRSCPCSLQLQLHPHCSTLIHLLVLPRRGLFASLLSSPLVFAFSRKLTSPMYLAGYGLHMYMPCAPL